MKNQLHKTLILGLISFVLLHGGLKAQTQISFEESIIDTISPASEIETYHTPSLESGDIVFIRVSPEVSLVRPRIRLINQAGVTIATAQTMTYNVGVDLISQVPGGIYTITVSDVNSTNSGRFCISFNRLNSPPEAVLMGCNSNQNSTLECRSSIKTFKYSVLEGALAEIVVTPTISLVRPKVWICNPDGNIIARDSTNSYNTAVSVTVPPQPQTQCFYIIVTDLTGFNQGNFSISHGLLAGECISAVIESTPEDGLVCAGDTFNLNASTTANNPIYSWTGPGDFASDQPEILFENAQSEHSGTYHLTVTDENNCVLITKSKDIYVIDFSLSTQATPDDGMVCVGDAFDIGATTEGAENPSYSWKWPNGSISDQNSVSIDNATLELSGEFIVTVTEGMKGCMKNDTTEITVHPLPTAIIQANPTENIVCVGETFTLSVTTNAMNPTYSWTKSGSFISNDSMVTMVQANIDDSGEYRVVVTDGVTECSESATVNFTVYPIPTAIITPTPSDGQVCEGESITLSVTTNAANPTYIWTKSGEFLSSDAVLIIENVTIDESGEYMVTVEENGCAESDNANITINPLPDVSITTLPNNNLFCVGDTFILSSTTNIPNPIYLWTGPGGFSSNLPLVTIENAMTIQSGIYMITVWDEDTECSSSEAIIITITEPSVSIVTNPTSENSFCEGESFSLNVVTNAMNPIYLWTKSGEFLSSDSVITIENATMNDSGEYTVTVRDGQTNCLGSDIKNIIVHPLPTFSLAVNPSDGTVCEGDTFTLDVSPTSPDFTYLWNGPLEFVSEQPAVTINNSILSQAGIYSVTVIDINGCFSDSETMIDVLESPMIGYTVVEDDLNVSASGGTPPYEFTISGGSFGSDFPFPDSIENIPNGNYIIGVTDDKGCTDTNSITIMVVSSLPIDPIAEWGVSVSPNPGNGLFRITLNRIPSNPMQLQVFDQTGNILYTSNIVSEVTPLDLTLLPEGVYFLRVFDGEKIGSTKIVLIK